MPVCAEGKPSEGAELAIDRWQMRCGLDAAEFDAHPNREEMINAAENECEAGIQPEGRLLVALHNYKSAWSRLTDDSSTPHALVMPEERREKREKREERREKRDEIASQESIAHL